MKLNLRRRLSYFRCISIVLLGALVIVVANTRSRFVSDEPSDCKTIPREFNGSLLPVIDLLMNDSYRIVESDLIANNIDMLVGEMWRPVECKPFQNVAIIIPVRDRDEHLFKLLYLLIPLLKKQKISFRIIVTEQRGIDMFNKGRLLNAAFDYARNNYPVDCVIFHDVDMLPENDQIPYVCSAMPTHLGAYVNSFDYILPYWLLAGGVLALYPKQMELVNGYSNEYWGWGAEDDDIGKRIMSKRMLLTRLDPLLTRFTMLTHTKRGNQEPMYTQLVLRDALKRITFDGLNSKVWAVIEVSRTELFDRLLIDVGVMSPLWRQAFDRMRTPAQTTNSTGGTTAAIKVTTLSEQKT